MGLTRYFRKKSAEKNAAASQDLLDSTALSTPHMSLRQTLKAAWKLSKPYFTGSDRKAAAYLVTGIAATMMAQVALAEWANNIQALLYHSLDTLSRDEFHSSLIQTAICAPAFVLLSKYKPLMRDMLVTRWQKWMMDHHQNAYVMHGAYYGLQRQDRQAAAAQGRAAQERKAQKEKAGAGKGEDEEDQENEESGENENDNLPSSHPEQRLADDFQEFARSTVSNAAWTAEAAVTFAWFSTVLTRATGWLPVSIGGYEFSVPLYMVGLAALYSGLCTYAVTRAGNKLNDMYTKLANREGDYRNAVARMGEHAESIALAGGERAELGILEKMLRTVVRHRTNVVKKNSSLNGFYTAFYQLSDLLPMAALAPRVFAGDMDIATMRLAAGAFGQVERAQSLFVYSYGDIQSYKATTARLARFTDAVEQWNDTGRKAERNILREAFQKQAGQQTAVEVRDLTVSVEGKLLVKPFSLSLKPGDRLVISGEAGSGKSTLFRAFAGWWDEGAGSVSMRTPGRIFGMPQDRHLTHLNLRGLICYPDDVSDYADEEVKAALKEAGLGELEVELDNDRIKGNAWKRLSGGQQQRLFFARLFLQKPDIILLDEITASLDPASEKELYTKLIEKLPDSIIISISHREAVRQFHTMHAELENQELMFRPLGSRAQTPVSPSPVPAVA